MAGSRLGGGANGSTGSRCPSASDAASTTSSAATSFRPDNAAAAFAHSTIVTSARWLVTPALTVSCPTAA